MPVTRTKLVRVIRVNVDKLEKYCNENDFRKKSQSIPRVSWRASFDRHRDAVAKFNRARFNGRIQHT